MFYIFDLVYHYFSANSTHGTHSPFVYKIADTVIYKKSTKLPVNDKSAYLMNEISDYLQNDMHMSSVILESQDEWNVEKVLELQQKIPVVFIKDIYKDSFAKQKWSTILADQRIVVTIDLFYFGVVIFRKEQPKENFKLRFPYSKF